MSEFLSKIIFRECEYFVLRDDLIGGEFNGNKARKLSYLLNADLSSFKRIFSHGNSQSNAMAALSVFARMKNLEFHYHPTHISSFLAQNPGGNFAFALKNGMKITHESIEAAKADKNTLFIPEGVASPLAEQGFKAQAELIRELSKELALCFDVFLPSGTGTSAAFLAKNLVEFQIFTTPCVGDENYLKEQISSFGNFSNLHILKPAIKAYFGSLKPQFYEIWSQLKKQSGITFELIYDPQGWLTLLKNKSLFQNKVLYIHQGGLEGLGSQLARYERKYGVLP